MRGSRVASRTRPRWPFPGFEVLAGHGQRPADLRGGRHEPCQGIDPSATKGVYVGAANPVGVAQFASKASVDITLASGYFVGTAGFASMVGSSGNPPYP